MPMQVTLTNMIPTAYDKQAKLCRLKGLPVLPITCTPDVVHLGGALEFLHYQQAKASAAIQYFSESNPTAAASRADVAAALVGELIAVYNFGALLGLPIDGLVEISQRLQQQYLPPQQRPANEETPVAPSEGYAQAFKALVEDALRAQADLELKRSATPGE